MDFFLYLVVTAVYIMIIHFAIAIKGQFNIFLMTACFLFGGFIGWYFGAYEIGFVTAVVLSLLFW